MNPFQYLRAGSVAEAAQFRAQHPEARFLAGGMSLLPMMKQGLSAPTHLIDVTRIGELHGISTADDRLIIGGATTHHAVAASARVRDVLPSLAALARLIGDPAVRNRGTLGGAVVHGDPAADYPAAVVGLGAEIETQKRRIPAGEFFQGLYTTALELDEIVLRIHFPRASRAHYEKWRHPVSGYAMAGVFVACVGSAVRVAITGLAGCAFRWEEAERALGRYFGVAAVQDLTLCDEEITEDLHASAAYRAELARTLLKRAVRTLGGPES